jgi:hypothetical protein
MEILGQTTGVPYAYKLFPTPKRHQAVFPQKFSQLNSPAQQLLHQPPLPPMSRQQHQDSSNRRVYRKRASLPFLSDHCPD